MMRAFANNMLPDSVPGPSCVSVLQRKCACNQTSGSQCGCKDGNALHGASPMVQDVLSSSGQPLEASTRAFMESRFGHDFSRVRVHADGRAADSARAVDARAYTVGSEIVFSAGQYTPATSEGRRLLAHELAHVVQQSRSGAPVSASEVSAADGAAEKEADRAASLVDSSPVAVSPLSHAGSGLQRAPIEEDEIHKPMIEEYRKHHGLPPGGVDESGKRVGPSDAEIKYSLLPAAGGSPTGVPYCPSVEVLEGNFDLSNEKTKRAYKDANCLSSESKAMLPACQFTPSQSKALEEAQKTAGGRVERALGLINMGPDGKKMAKEMARELFEYDPPTLAQVVDRATRVRDFLKTAKIDFAGRTCGDSECQRGYTAYVTRSGALPIYICPTSFSMPSTLHQTVLHEALHWTGLDADPFTPEGYCNFDCRTPCKDKEVADSWAHYLDCLGKPFTIRKDFQDKVIESVKHLP